MVANKDGVCYTKGVPFSDPLNQKEVSHHEYPRNIDTFTDAQLVNVVAMLQAMRQTIDDLEDEAFCEKMAQDYDNDPEKGDPMPLENFAKELGITL